MIHYLRFTMVFLALLLFSGVNAYAKKPEIVRHDAQYLDKAVKITVQWQSTEPIVSVKVAAGKEAKEIKIDPYSNKRNPAGYSGEEDIVLQTEPGFTQESIPYSIQIEDEDGQKSNLVTGKAQIPASVVKQQDDEWGKNKLAGQGQQGGQRPDMIDKLRQVAQVLASPPFIHDVTVNNPGTGTVTFKTKATHSVGLKEINFRVFDGSNKQIDSQQISATGTLWEGTSKDITLPPGNYFVIAQAIDGGGSTSPEKKASFAIAGTATSAQPAVQPPATLPETPPVQPSVPPPATLPETPPVQPSVQPPVQPPVTQQNMPSVSEPVIYSNGNIAGVQNNPTSETTFTIEAMHQVTFIYTYHYFNNGKLPGTIALGHADGTVYGPWQAAGARGQGGVPNAYWFVLPNVELKPGTYTVIDSDRATWSHNYGSYGAGFVEIRGIKTGPAQPR